MEIEIHGLRTHNVEICENVENMAYVLMKIKRKMCYLRQIGAIHKRRRNILGGEWGLKFRCCKILEGRG